MKLLNNSSQINLLKMPRTALLAEPNNFEPGTKKHLKIHNTKFSNEQNLLQSTLGPSERAALSPFKGQSRLWSKGIR